MPKLDSANSSKPVLPADAIKFAKSMGLDLNGYEAEAQEIWKKLDYMAASNPVEYQQFLSQQSDPSLLSQDKEEKSSKCFRPQIGYSVQTWTLGNDKLKIRDINGRGKLLYVNICSHLCIDSPMDEHGKYVQNFKSNANGLQVVTNLGYLSI
jgi:hypothetical protein